MIKFNRFMGKNTSQKRISILMGTLLITGPLMMPGCGVNDFSDFKRDALLGIGVIALILLSDGQITSLDPNDSSGGQGLPGETGMDGIHCWDLNANGVDDPEEDVNNDGVYDTLDCQGQDGTDGQNGTDALNGGNGATGATGATGSNGSDGVDGIDGIDGVDGIDGIDGIDGVDGIDGIDGVDGVDGIDGIDGIDGADGIDGIDGIDGVDGVDGIDGEASVTVESIFYDQFIDQFFTEKKAEHNGLPVYFEGLPIVEIEGPMLGPTKVIAYKTVIPQAFSENLNPGQNLVVMRQFFWREGPKEDCFVYRLDAFRSRHGMGITSYGAPRYIKLDDPSFSDFIGTMVVVDLPLNNNSDNLADGLGYPDDLQIGDFLAFELNIAEDSLINEEVSYTLLGVEFFEMPPMSLGVDHATVFLSMDELDCSLEPVCESDIECDDGQYCNGLESCTEGLCSAGEVPCDAGMMCNEVADQCVDCDFEVEEGKTAICHLPDSQFDRVHTLIVKDDAVQNHLDHGDTLGPCEEDCSGENN